MSLLNLLLPVACAGCGRIGPAACPECVAALQRPAHAVRPSPEPAGLPPCFAVAAYDGVVRELLLAAKERGAVGLLPVLAAGLATAVGLAVADIPLSRPLVLVPVPSTAAAIRTRGDDVVLGLARRAATAVRRRGRTVRVAPVLRHVRAVRDSAGLGSAERAANLLGALAVRPAGSRLLLDSAVVVVDDLITTGATVVEAARALRPAGATVCGAATVAATARRGSSLETRVAERTTVGALAVPP
ncbi:MAG TPA: phosphoribosyltransferase family protein [Mycobacteriales bacterium]|jgi:predicted amidophosphoribosyltransferase|nr:phosphoribosyltransferase family protein [Mycobacteriales bacterium]